MLWTRRGEQEAARWSSRRKGRCLQYNGPRRRISSWIWAWTALGCSDGSAVATSQSLERRFVGFYAGRGLTDFGLSLALLLVCAS